MFLPFYKNEIHLFRGKHKFLSNFFVREIIYKNKRYKSSEHAYQAAKTDDSEEQLMIQEAETPAEARALGQLVKCRPNWENIKADIMLEILRIKFKHPDLRKLLLETGTAYLEEGNHWHDQFFGVCYCSKHKGRGLNWLGKLLMKVRIEIGE